MTRLFTELLRILNDSSPFLLAGFLLAGLLHVLLDRRRNLLAPLEGPGARPVVLAALVGIPLPLCSCSVLPAGLTLRRRGAGKGTTASFLISVPETDVVSILLTYALIGPAVAFFRPITAIAIGIVAGLVINIVERRRVNGAGRPGEASAGIDSSCADCGPAETPPPAGGATGDHAASHRARIPRGIGPAWLREALAYGFVEFFDDLIGQLLLGIVVGAVIAALMPDLTGVHFAGARVLTYGAMLLLGIPLYVCASASTPIAAGLIASGVSPGAALVFLLAGPATNLGTLFVLEREFGRRIFAIYLGVIAVMSVAAGLFLDMHSSAIRLALPATRAGLAAGEPGRPVALVATILLLALALASFWRRHRFDRAVARIEEAIGIHVSRRVAATVAVALLVAAYLASGFFIVRPDERASVTRFGAVTASYLGPGCHYHWPYPMGRADRVSVKKIRRIEIGFRSGPDSTLQALPPAQQDEEGLATGFAATHGSPSESWMLSGDENIVDIQAVAQYQVMDTPEAVNHYLYDVADPLALVRAAAIAALQVAIGARPIDSLLTSSRDEVETQVRDGLMQPALDACGSGIRVVGFKLTSVHAPSPVHPDFRDVASAVEDAITSVNQAREYAEKTVLGAEADSARGLALAHGQAADRVGIATGDAASFVSRSAEYRRAPDLMRTRLYFEKLDKVLPGLDLYVDLTNSGGKGPSIWISRGGAFPVPPQTSPALPKEGNP